MRARILRKAIQYKTGTEFYRECVPSISYREALEAIKATKKMALSEAEAEDADYLWHLCQGHGILTDWLPSVKGQNSWQIAGEILYREWPENTSRIRRGKIQRLLIRFGFDNPKLLLAKLDRERWVTWERVADLDQIGLNPRFIKNGLPRVREILA